jgi:hypothetical protein
LAVCDGRADLFRGVQGGQQGSLLVARWAGATLLAGEGDKHLVHAVGAAHAGKHYKIDPDRICASGFSGGMMCCVLMY